MHVIGLQCCFDHSMLAAATSWKAKHDNKIDNGIRVSFTDIYCIQLMVL